MFLKAPDTFKRSTEDRRGIRERKFRKYFSTNEFTLITKYHGEIPIEGTEMFCWEKVHPDDSVLRKIVDRIGGKGGYLVYGERKEKAYRALIVYLREKAPLTYDHITIDGLSVDVYTAGRHVGLVVGFRGEGGWEMGKLVSLRPLKRQWVFLCPVKVGRPFEVCLGRIVFDEEDIEYGSLSKGFFA